MPTSERCVVRLLDLYILIVPPDPSGFYLRPLDKVPSGNRPWYRKSRVGINKLKMVMLDTVQPQLSELVETTKKRSDNRGFGKSRL